LRSNHNDIDNILDQIKDMAALQDTSLSSITEGDFIFA